MKQLISLTSVHPNIHTVIRTQTHIHAGLWQGAIAAGAVVYLLWSHGWDCSGGDAKQRQLDWCNIIQHCSAISHLLMNTRRQKMRLVKIQIDPFQNMLEDFNCVQRFSKKRTG